PTRYLCNCGEPTFGQRTEDCSDRFSEPFEQHCDGNPQDWPCGAGELRRHWGAYVHSFPAFMIAATVQFTIVAADKVEKPREPQIGREVAIERHLADDEEFQIPL